MLTVVVIDVLLSVGVILALGLIWRKTKESNIYIRTVLIAIVVVLSIVIYTIGRKLARELVLSDDKIVNSPSVNANLSDKNSIFEIFANGFRNASHSNKNTSISELVKMIERNAISGCGFEFMKKDKIHYLGPNSILLEAAQGPVAVKNDGSFTLEFGPETQKFNTETDEGLFLAIIQIAKALECERNRAMSDVALATTKAELDKRFKRFAVQTAGEIVSQKMR